MTDGPHIPGPDEVVPAALRTWSYFPSGSEYDENTDEIRVCPAGTNRRPTTIAERKRNESPGAERKVPKFFPKDSPSIRLNCGGAA
jgi:hypothetical protein